MDRLRIGMSIKDPKAQAVVKGVAEQGRVPTCPGCKAKFQFDRVMMACRVCGLPAEVAARGLKAVQRWQKGKGQPVGRGGSFYRRRRRHGRCQPAPYRAMPT